MIKNKQKLKRMIHRNIAEALNLFSSAKIVAAAYGREGEKISWFRLPRTYHLLSLIHFRGISNIMIVNCTINIMTSTNSFHKKIYIQKKAKCIKTIEINLSLFMERIPNYNITKNGEKSIKQLCYYNQISRISLN